MRSWQCFRFASCLAPVLLIACTSDNRAPATTPTAPIALSENAAAPAAPPLAAPAAAATSASLAGSATYRERMALTPGDVFEASLEDVSRADAAAEILASTRLATPGQVPIRFSLEYDPGRIDPRHR